MISLSLYLILSLIIISQAYGFGVGCKNGHRQNSDPHDDQDLAIPDDGVKRQWKNVKVALFGDQGLSKGSRKVLKMVRDDFGADFVIHVGDFDYQDSPEKFGKQFRNVFGKKYPYFATVGNHDLPQWKNYSRLLVEQLKNGDNDKYCKGEYGVNMVCDYKGVVFVLSGVGTMGADHAKFIDKAFSHNPGKWKICAWHKNQHAYQLGTKPDETGYEVYEICRKHGAIIITGHEHSFSRTHIMTDYAKKVVDLDQANEVDGILKIGYGKSLAIVAGVAGYGIRTWDPKAKANDWWAATAAANNALNYGAMLCTFYVNGRADQAHCYFQDIDGKIWDNFSLNLDLNPASEPKDLECFHKTLETKLSSFDVNFDGSNSEALQLTSLPSSVALTYQTEDYVPPGDSFYQVMLEFENIAEFASLKAGTIKDATLQFYGVDAEGDATLLITGIDKLTGQRTQAQVLWQSREDDEEVEPNSVWMSPDISQIIEELMEMTGSRGAFAFEITSEFTDSLRKVKGPADSCLSPVLSIHLKSHC